MECLFVDFLSRFRYFFLRKSQYYLYNANDLFIIFHEFNFQINIPNLWYFSKFFECVAQLFSFDKFSQDKDFLDQKTLFSKFPTF